MTNVGGRILSVAALLSTVLLTACGGSGYDGGGGGAQSYTVGGTVSGLSGSGLVLQDNGGDDLAVSSDGSFVFATKVASGAPYSVTIKTPPSKPSQTCALSSASGTVGSGIVTNVAVKCTTDKFGVGGIISGLTGAGLVLQDNGGDDLALSSNGGFAFATRVASGAPYSVTVRTQPSNPSQTCALTNASGTIGSGNVTNVALACAINTFAVGGTVTGLSGTGLVLQDNGGDDLAVSSNGSFVFATGVASGAVYSVTVKIQPTGPTQNCAVANGSGTVGAAGVATVDVSCGPIALLAGALGGEGALDGEGSAARFHLPFGLATDSAGNVYVADTYNTAIRKVTPAGVVTTWAGAAGQVGSTDGSRSAARFKYPGGIATDSADNVYVADTGNCAIRKITPAGVVSTFAGGAVQGSTDCTGAQFNLPYGIATDPAGNVYVADTYNHTIRKITPAGVVSTLAGMAGQRGPNDGSGSAARFDTPQSVATDSAGNVYVADTLNHTIRKITPAGAVSTLAGAGGQYGSSDGTGSAARFNGPYGVGTDSAGNVYVADTGNNTIRKITPAGAVSTVAGMPEQSGSTDGSGSAARFSSPSHVATDAAGNLYVTDAANQTIRKITPSGVVSTLAGAAPQIGLTNGSGSAARFNVPYGVAADSVGNVYVGEKGNSTIRKITPAGVVSTLAGTGQHGPIDGAGAVAQFNEPSGVATDSARNVYVADSSNHTIRKITPAGVVSTLAGAAGQRGSTNGTAAAARFNYPYGIATDSAGNVYVADTYNDMIRKITPAGVVSTLAGMAQQEGSADGTGSAARFTDPFGIIVDSAGNVYVSDTDNHTIRKITPTGVVSTLAGTAGQKGSIDGSGSAARFNSPVGIAMDSAGNLYVADTGNHTIRKITATGVVTTVVGTPGAQGVRLGALPGSINSPTGLVVLPGSGVTLLETDAENSILQITLP